MHARAADGDRAGRSVYGCVLAVSAAPPIRDLTSSVMSRDGSAATTPSVEMSNTIEYFRSARTSSMTLLTRSRIGPQELLLPLAELVLHLGPAVRERLLLRADLFLLLRLRLRAEHALLLLVVPQQRIDGRRLLLQLRATLGDFLVERPLRLRGAGRRLDDLGRVQVDESSPRGRAVLGHHRRGGENEGHGGRADEIENCDMCLNSSIMFRIPGRTGSGAATPDPDARGRRGDRSHMRSLPRSARKASRG